MTVREEVGISLGYNCQPAMSGIATGLRKRKKDGYKTCPFDLILSNYEGIILALQEDFAGFCDPANLELKMFNSYAMLNEWIYNKKYKFFFNHESPQHAGLHFKENWPSPNYFVENSFEKFIERFQARIENFREYMKSGKFINFVINRPLPDVSRLEKTIKNIYPNLLFKIHVICLDDPKYFTMLLENMNLTECDEYKTLKAL